MQISKFNNRKILLLGAGFSKNFGGFLADEVYLKIFNHPQLTQKLKNFLLNYVQSYNFEQYCEEVLNSKVEDFSQEEKKIVEEILRDVFQQMDIIFQNRTKYPLNFSYLKLIAFIVNRFAYANGGAGFIFSLNQDLLLERLFADYLKNLEFNRPTGWGGESQGILLPYYGPINIPFYKCHKDDNRAQTFERLEEITEEKINEWRKISKDWYEGEANFTPCLVKLHGSYYWHDVEDSKVWVIGTESKKEKIDSVPILKLYFDKFKDVMAQPNRELFVIGYSFRDPHINQIIANSCQLGTRLIVFNVEPLLEWVEHVKCEFGKIGIEFSIDWLMRYHKGTFNEIFPCTFDEKDFKFDGDNRRSMQKLKEVFDINL